MLTISQNKTAPPIPAGNERVHSLVNSHKNEVLNFLAARPRHTFIMTSWIRDNGLVSDFNRGRFYGCRDAEGRLQGVALIGHITLFETEMDPALAAFASLTHGCPTAHTVLGEENQVSQFLNYYARGGQAPRMVCRDLLFEKRAASYVETVPSLRPATIKDLDLIVPAHAQTALEESGINPLEADPEGFRQRCARRVEQRRVWVSIEQERLKFKADIVSNTPEVVYIEGVYVSSEHRGNGYGARCMTQLTNSLLSRTKSVCLLVSQTNSAAQACYRKAGYKLRETYDTLYLAQQKPF